MQKVRYYKGIADTIRESTEFIYLIIPQGIYVIEDYELQDCKMLYMVKLPITLMKIGNGAFLNCQSLTYIVGYRKGIILADDSFENCEKLVSGCFDLDFVP